jgi:hypothetical protein
VKVYKTDCGHVEQLITAGYLDVGDMFSPEVGDVDRAAPILRRLKSGRSGALSVTRDWTLVRHCPVCGEAVRYEDIATATATPAQGR